MTDANSAVYEAYFIRLPFQLLTRERWKRLLAFRVDSEGVLLGGAPARYATQTAFVPWADITSIVAWRQRTAGNGINYIGVQRKPGSPDLPGMNSRLSPKRTAKLAPHVDHDLFLASRPINFWRLDPERLLAAAGAFAPHVPVLVYSQPHLR
ncbi:hypothetical protein ACFW17_29820 [Streptomyces sp. NPDC058961]|uniref:hypothetical protein n=1 Tax=Streptomyces sp. NPDC058961 TaxID=3346680 RepID=UPI00368DDC64